MRITIIVTALLALALMACGGGSGTASTENTSAQTIVGPDSATSDEVEPAAVQPTVQSLAELAAGKHWLIMGQDLDGLRDYKASDCCPNPPGVTSYLNFYGFLDANQGYGGLGLTPDGAVHPVEIDWGGGPVHLINTARDFPDAFHAIGLSMVENQTPNGLSKIIAGDYDAEIEQLAVVLKRIDQPILLRIGYEFDGAWNQGYENTTNFIGAFQRIVDGLRSAGVSQLETVWQASAAPADDSIDGGVREDISAWYPGDEYVDWVGLSWFLPPDEIGAAMAANGAPSQRVLADEVLSFARLNNKPVIIAEASPQGFYLSQNYRANIGGVIDGPSAENRREVSGDVIWQTWYQPLFDYIESNADVIRALAYINTEWDTQDLWDAPYEGGFWGDSRVQANPVVLEKWLETINSPVWLHSR